MKLAIFADAHHRGQDLASGLAVQAAAFRAMNQAGVSLTLDAGDTFDRAQIGDRYAFPGTVLAGYLDAVRWLESPLHVIEGNHTLGRPGQHGPLAALGAHPRVTVWTRPGVHRVDNVAIAMLPWASKLHFVTRPDVACLPPDEQTRRFHEACRAILVGLREDSRWEEASYRILLGHAEVSGATTPHGYILEGETFRFAGSDLAQTGANLVAFGHYHKRQQIPGCPNGWYVGALRQLNHGEEGNPSGWLLVDTETGDLDWREVDCPRYYTIPAEEFRPELHQTTDRIKLRGTTRPPELPENVVFEAVGVLCEVQARSTLDPSSHPATLLEAWAEANGEEVDPGALAPLLAELDQTQRGPELAHGTIDRIIEIQVCGFGPHRDTHITLDQGDWWAVCGPNGTGKSILVEAPLACWYGCWAHPHRSTLAGLATAEQSRLMVVWESAGIRYRATRQLQAGKSQKHEATLTRIEGHREVPLAGPKVLDFQAAVRSIVGPEDLVLASVWLTQKAEGDLVGADPAGRKKIMRQFLGLDLYDVLTEACKTKAQELDARLRASERELAARSKLKEELAQADAQLTRARTDDAGLEAKEACLAASIRDLRERLVEQTTRAARRDEVAARVTRCEAVLAADREKVLALDKRAAGLKARLDEEPVLREKAQQLEPARQALQDAMLAAQARAEVDAERLRLTTEKAAIERAINNQAHLREATVQRMQAELRERQAEVEKIASKESRLQTVGCAPNILPCRLIDDHVAEIKRLPDLRAGIADLQEYLDEAELTLIERAFAQDERAKLAELDGQLAALVVPPTPDLRPIQAQLAELEQVESRLAALAEVRQSLEQVGADLNYALEAADDSARQLEAAQTELAGCEVVETAVLDTLDVAERDLRLVQGERRNHAGYIGTLAATAESTRAALSALDTLASQMEESIRARDGYRLLERAFGRDGIPQLLIASAIPAIQAILDEVCEVDFRGRFTLRLDTLRQTKTAGSKESFDILLGRRGREYDARGASGGEEAAVRAALRTALVLYLADRASASCRVAVLDEPAAHQDAENAEATLAMLDRLKSRFQQLILVTHDEDLIGAFPHRVCLEEGPRGTRVAGQEPIKTEEEPIKTEEAIAA